MAGFKTPPSCSLFVVRTPAGEPLLGRTASDVSGFTGMQVTVTLSAESQNPQEILIRARLADGHEIVALADGSIHQSPSTRKTNGVVHR